MNLSLSMPRLRRKEVPQYLKDVHGIDIAVATLNKLASVGGGPAMRYAGRIPLYDKTALDQWAADRLGDPVASTSERGVV
jgi:hypothetical protein